MEVLLMKKIADNTLIENAILAFLHNYPDHKWVDEYKILLDKIQSLPKVPHPLDEQSKTPTVQKRGRPAKRARTKETSSNEASKEEVKTS